MTVPPSALDAPVGPRARGQRARRIAAFVVGVLLLAAAIYVVLSRREDAAGAWRSVRSAPPALIALALVLPLVNLLLSSTTLWVQMRRHPPRNLGAGEMLLVIAAAWLLNHLPLRPGMFGRIAYHRAVNGIGIGDSVRAIVIGLVGGIIAVLTALGIAAALGADSSPWLWGVGMAAPAVLSLVAMGLTVRSGTWWLPAVFLCRYADVLVWALRYWVVFRLIGSPIGPGQSMAAAAVCQLAINIPLVGNGMGLREWGVGLVASKLPPGFLDSSGGIAVSAGLTADLVNRAAELLVLAPLGVLACLYVGRRVTGSGGRPPTAP